MIGVILKFGLTDQDRDEIIDKITAGAGGFFLYAKVVLENLWNQGSEAELQDELVTSNFPETLSAAYERVVIRVFKRGHRAKIAAATKILGWMTCATRPLYWREIQSRFCIDPNLGYCNFKNRRVDSCKVLCISLVEQDEEMTVDGDTEEVVRFVHNTAGRYLIHTGHIDLLEEHTRMALFCSRYLTSQPFHKGLRAEPIQEFALSGYYGFLDYAVATWLHHLSFVLDGSSNLAAGEIFDLLSSATNTLQTYDIPEGSVSTLSSSTQKASTEPTIQKVQVMLREWRQNGKRCHLEKRISIIRDAMESIDVSALNERARTIFLGLNGPSSFKCPRSDCHNFNNGFSCSQARDVHMADHERPFKCLARGCFAGFTGFRTKSELQVHTKLHHPADEPPAYFPRLKKKAEKSIFDACIKGDLDSVKSFLERGVDVNRPHCIGLWANYGSTEIAKMLILADDGAAANTRNLMGQFPLHLACKKSDAKLVALLVSHTNDLNARDEYNKSPLDCGLSALNIEAVKILLETKRVNGMERDDSGKTPFEYVLGLRDDFSILRLVDSHPAVVTDGTLGRDIRERVVQRCIQSEAWYDILHIFELEQASQLAPESIPTLHQQDYGYVIPSKLVLQLLREGEDFASKACLSTGRVSLSVDEALEMWNLTKDKKDAELRALVLLHEQFSPDIWKGQLPEMKRLLGEDYVAKQLLRLLASDSYSRQVLSRQAELQEDEELRDLLSKRGFLV
ncbi:hypothetical protein FZEAL_5896 [Fusarium zealandicum]|uniref:GPI inositol-deacylase winged helix domain-containing protein n=1 Tax=Fusarium zealandicum TaxID=1053134 RepID=A0A8H4XJD0_9HYPO|nr:hypothetical protein FZEAL_5896 [Fusarium zealandicum]